jgi:hypothetical protein
LLSSHSAVPLALRHRRWLDRRGRDRRRAEDEEGDADKPDSFFIKPSGVAETAFQITCQHPGAWRFEAGARPFGERE